MFIIDSIGSKIKDIDLREMCEEKPRIDALRGKKMNALTDAELEEILIYDTKVKIILDRNRKL